MTELSFRNLVRGKSVVFITVKNRDYIRTTQLKRLLEKEASSFSMYSSEKGNPLTRALDLRRRIDKIDLSHADVVVVGFLPQLIWDKVVEKVGGRSGNNAGKKSGGADNDAKAVLVADMFLSLYDTVILDRKLFRDGWWMANFLRKLDKRVIDSAKLIVTDTKANADFLVSLYEADKAKFQTLYLAGDKDLYGSCGAYPELESGSVSVLYFGTGLPLQGTDTVMKAFTLVADKGIQCTFVGSTKGIARSVLKEAKSNPNIELIKWLPQKVLAGRIAEADLCIAGHFNLYIDKAARTIPGKAIIYDAMNKPMILGDTKANREIFKEDEKHVFVRRGNPEELAKCIKRFLL